MVYGARDLGSVSLVKRNFVSESQTSSGIVLGGGPAIVANNAVHTPMGTKALPLDRLGVLAERVRAGLDRRTHEL